MPPALLSSEGITGGAALDFYRANFLNSDLQTERFIDGGRLA